MKILVLGGTGYLGYNIVNGLLRQGHDVLCVIRNTSDIRRLKKKKIYRYVLNDMESLENSFCEERIDWIINGVCTYKANDNLYGDMFESNIIFPLSVLNLAIKYGIVNFLTMGTSLPNELNVYSFTKSKFSEFGKFLSERDNLNFIELKLEMFYGGEFEPQNRFIRDSINKLKENRILELTEGTQKRDLIHMSDIIQIIMRILNVGGVSGCHIFPVGTGESHSIKEIIYFLKEKLQSTSEINFGSIPMRSNEPDTCADIAWYDEYGINLHYSYWQGLNEELSRL